MSMTEQNMNKFTAALEALLLEHGMTLSATPEITLSKPENEFFVGAGMELDTCRAIRERQPFELWIRAQAYIVGTWHHVSGDDRRLHPDLRSNSQGAAGSSAAASGWRFKEVDCGAS